MALHEGGMSEASIRGRIVGKLRDGFAAIEEMGFDGNSQFQQEWEEHKAQVEDFFKNHHPSEPGFQEARRALSGAWHAKCQDNFVERTLQDNEPISVKQQE
eukprot:CAMPEP_0114248332 /NCGR_PEP_ID=MMETSP0058-20121206/13516_1 /TAXON_ID=36894 /ORGANISM="Pyramimonas parkeae, CCMP726" /LENGTH=100 /DNA_ID=CAMNT_0001361731 /DNA_START=428 /DNA_END=730 /DNA_ORIENTATION=+